LQEPARDGEVRRVVIMGAAGRDFHNFNVVFRGDERYEVVAFTAAQIIGIEGRTYPPELAGSLYPEGIPIVGEEELPDLVRRRRVDEVVFAYSDVPHEYVMRRASLALSLGADFRLLGTRSTMLRASKPVVAVTAVRTGAGKSQTTRRVAELLRDAGARVTIVRHPMPYGRLSEQACQRFESFTDLDRHRCTIEEREEYEPHLERGTVVYAGVDYERVLRQAESTADVVLWDGGNNDLPFFQPDVHIVVCDPHRAGDETSYYPGESNLLLADIAVINKVDTAEPDAVESVRRTVLQSNPDVIVVEAASPVSVDDAVALRGKTAVVVEDGPTLTHGEMSYGAGVVAARKFGARELVDPRRYAVGSIRRTYELNPHIGPLVPAMGYEPHQVTELVETLNATPADLIVVATPVDLRRLAAFDKPVVRVRYELDEIGRPDLADALRAFSDRLGGLCDAASAREATVTGAGPR